MLSPHFHWQNPSFSQAVPAPAAPSAGPNGSASGSASGANGTVATTVAVAPWTGLVFFFLNKVQIMFNCLAMFRYAYIMCVATYVKYLYMHYFLQLHVQSIHNMMYNILIISYDLLFALNFGYTFTFAFM
jgi:hypothetical protein